MCCSPAGCIANTGPQACCGTGAVANAYCAGLLDAGKATCDNNVCTACDAIAGTTYVVDPINGSDSGGTGNPTSSPSCALKTIKRALQIIGTPITATTIQIVGGGTSGSNQNGGVASLANGETYPIVVPANVTIETLTGTGGVTANVTGTANGFTIAGAKSAINGTAGAPLTITSTSAAQGVLVHASSTLASVTITGFSGNGIVSTAGTLTIGSGTASNGNGEGILVTTGETVIDPTTNPGGGAAAPITFNGNAVHGILVEGTGYIHVAGKVTDAATGVGTVQTNGNKDAGVWIQQASGVTKTETNLIDGLVSYGNTSGNGMRIVTGSFVTVTNSVFLANAGNGVIVSEGPAKVADFASISLGGASKGGNTFQAASGAGNNGGAGLCIDLPSSTGTQTLLAQGNTFQSGNPCTGSTPPTLYENKAGCANNKTACSTGICDLGLETPKGGVATGYVFDVSTCKP
jgi:hypothetical protein